jgi:osmoprotectant transport system permease protein
VTVTIASSDDAATASVDPKAPHPVAAARDRSWLTLAITPVVLGLLAGMLWWFVAGAEKDSQEVSALRWSERLYPQLRDHIDLTLWSTLWVLLIAIPLGVALTRPRLRRFGSPLLAVASSGQAIPAYGLLVLLLTWLGSGPRTAIVALVIYTVLPVLRNTMVGLDQVDKSVIEAGRGMGMTRLQALLRIELPLAVPVILAGVRTALVINVGTATLAFVIGGGGLGIVIFSGIQLNRELVLFTGAAMTALLALTVDWVAAVVERILRPKGL